MSGVGRFRIGWDIVRILLGVGLAMWAVSKSKQMWGSGRI